jgi:hypothetical protein
MHEIVEPIRDITADPIYLMGGDLILGTILYHWDSSIIALKSLKESVFSDTGESFGDIYRRNMMQYLVENL